MTKKAAGAPPPSLAPAAKRSASASEPAPAAKRPAPAAASCNNDPVPAKAARIPAPAVAPVEKPKLLKPIGPNRDVLAKQHMKKIMPWVNQELESFLLQEKVLEPGQHLSDLRPLNISDKKREVIGTSYKQPWIPENAKMSMTLSG